MSLAWEKYLVYEKQFLQAFGKRNNINTQYVANARLSNYRQLLDAHSSEPDLLEIDVVWPAILADDLVDLRPFLKERVNAFPAELLANYTVNGRLVALPLFVDVGILYYRSDLLAKYGFQRPPVTWDELEHMAAAIQKGERHAGRSGFWGYVWQGALSEGGTCNALEFQSSAGGGNFIEPTGMVHVRGPVFAASLQRAKNWLGTISPPAEYVYWEDDSMNLWDAGQTAFMRNWASGYGHVSEGAAREQRPFGVAPLPAGPGGHRGTLGGLGIGISKYAANPEMALKALLELADETHDLERLRDAGGLPTHISLSNRADVRARSSLLAISAELMNGLVARPSAIAGGNYEKASREYATAVNSILRGKAAPAVALTDLERKLTNLTGLPASRD